MSKYGIAFNPEKCNFYDFLPKLYLAAIWHLLRGRKRSNKPTWEGGGAKSQMEQIGMRKWNGSRNVTGQTEWFLLACCFFDSLINC